VVSLKRFGWHTKPFGLLDIGGFYRSLLEFLDHTRNEGFIRPQHRELVLVADGPEKMLQQLRKFKPSSEVKWVK
jgi:predicted Rossmann-fold nucleotide-binding protein